MPKLSRSLSSNRFSILSLAVATAFSSLSSQAATDDTIVVVATRQPSRVNALTADVTVLDREQIEEAGPSATIGDLLARSAGVELSRTGSRGASEGIFLRGASTNHTLVLVDGMRVSSATMGTTAIEAIPLNQIERIEILRGPASAMYGSDAIGGVVSITTRHGGGAPKFDFGVGIGSHGAQELSLAHAGRVGEVDYALRYGDSQASGVNSIINTNSAGYNPDNDGFWRRNLSLSAIWRLSQETELGGSWLESDGMNRFDGMYGPKSPDWQTRQKLLTQSVYVKHKLTNDWSSELRFGRSEDKSVSTPSQNPPLENDRYRTQRDQFVWQNNVTLPLGQGLVALETLRENVESNAVAYTDINRHTDSLVLGWSGSQAAHFWQVGARRDINSQFGGRNTETLGYGYRLNENWRASASVGNSFRAPSFNDLYWPGAGNPNLQPETGKNRELALRYTQKGVEASLTAFRNDVRNLIQWAPVGALWLPSNVGEALITGWAATWHSRHGAWLLDANFNSQVPKDALSGKYLARRARDFGSVSLTREEGAWRTGVEVQGASKRFDTSNTVKMGGYGLVNAHGEYRMDNNWSLVGRIDNLFDRSYELAHEPASFWNPPTIYNHLGRTVFLGARFTLK